MKIFEIEKLDVLEATVIGFGKDGAYLCLNDLEVEANAEPPIVRLYDWSGQRGDRLLVSVSKVSEDRGYIRTRLDSLRNPLAA